MAKQTKESLTVPRVLSLPGAQGGFVGDPTLLARDNIFQTVLVHG